MKTVNIHTAKTHLSELVEEAAAGKEIIIAKAGTPKARLVPLEQPKFERKPGMWKGLIKIHDNFDDSLPPDIAYAFGIIDEPPARHARAPVVRKRQPPARASSR